MSISVIRKQLLGKSFTKSKNKCDFCPKICIFQLFVVNLQSQNHKTVTYER